MINKVDRLGLGGIKNLDQVTESITQVDVSVITDNEDPPSKFSNHRYFYMSPTIRKDMALFFLGEGRKKIPRRKRLGHDRKYMLEMPEKADAR